MAGGQRDRGVRLPAGPADAVQHPAVGREHDLGTARWRRASSPGEEQDPVAAAELVEPVERRPVGGPVVGDGEGARLARQHRAGHVAGPLRRSSRPTPSTTTRSTSMVGSWRSANARPGGTRRGGGLVCLTVMTGSSAGGPLLLEAVAEARLRPAGRHAGAEQLVDQDVLDEGARADAGPSCSAHQPSHPAPSDVRPCRHGPVTLARTECRIGLCGGSAAHEIRRFSALGSGIPVGEVLRRKEL